MRNWLKCAFAVAAPLLLSSCLWGPGKFKSDLTLHRDGSFVLDYRGEIVIQIPKDEFSPRPWKDSQAFCYEKISTPKLKPAAFQIVPIAPPAPAPPPPAPPGLRAPIVAAPMKPRACTPAEIAQQKSEWQKIQATAAAKRREEAQKVAKMYGLPGLDDASSQEFAAKLRKYAGWRSVTYRGNGVYDVDYHFVGSARQDFVFPALPDNDFLLPFIAIRRRADGAVLVTAPQLVGGAGPLGSRGTGLWGASKGAPTSRANGRFTIITDGEILTNNSEDGPSATAGGREVHWDVQASSMKMPEALIRL